VIHVALMLMAAGQDVLVTTDWAYENLRNEKVRFVEVSVDPGVYEKGHLKGAVGFKWHSELCDPVSRDIVSPEKFQALCREAGISDDTTVVLYGDLNNWFACWGHWIFTMYGHKLVKLMDGGRKKWELDKRPLDLTAPKHPAGNFTAKVTNPELRVRLDEVVKVAKQPGPPLGVLVDVRSPDEHNGKVFAPPGIQELSIRAGCIPGSKNVPWSKAVNEDGTFKSKEELQKVYADVIGRWPIITYCRIGERSSHTWFVLKMLLGQDARNYDGSWTEYGNAVGVPIENKSGTVWTGK